DVHGNGQVDIITGTGSGAPHVKVFDTASGALERSFFAFDPQLVGGVQVATVGFNTDHSDDVLLGAGPLGAPQVRLLDFLTLAEVDNCFAFDPLCRGGVSVGGG